MCVCVCKREKKRERERENEKERVCIPLLITHVYLEWRDRLETHN